MGPLLLLVVVAVTAAAAPSELHHRQRRIAVIGGGISGTFVTKYLAEYDNNAIKNSCLIDEIVVFDVSLPPPGLFDSEDNNNSNVEFDENTYIPSSSSDPRPPNWQGSRVSSITLNDGNVVELGGSIIYNGNKLVGNMMDGDPTFLQRIPPMDGDNNDDDDNNNNSPRGFGIYHGNQTWLINTARLHTMLLVPSFVNSILESFTVLWRYGYDLLRMKRAVTQAIQKFDMIYVALNDTEHDSTYFNSPMDIWRMMGLDVLMTVSYHDLLDRLGLYRDSTLELISNNHTAINGGPSSPSSNNMNHYWDWRKWIPGMGCLRSELLSGVAINTYNQDLNQMNGLVGLVSFVPVGNELFQVKGGNHRLMESALRQAQLSYDMSSSCSDGNNNEGYLPSSQRRIHRQRGRITTVVSSKDSMELFEDNRSLGKFNIVILAAPLQQCRINFLIQSPMGLDETLLHTMPLSGMKENVDKSEVEERSSSSSSSSMTDNEYGHHSFASSLPASATVKYTSVVTTVISNATVNKTHFGLLENDPFPRSVLVSERGKYLEGITTLTILSNGLIKTFSSEKLDMEKRNILFGQYHIVEYEQIWGGGGEYGQYGGATPNFDGGRNSESLPFLLYDGAKHWGQSDGPALYYVNAIESAVAAIEISAIGAKATAKLVARRLGLIIPNIISHEEL